ncbi:MAG: formylglycine-generating enzyme family protein, partial [Candidatus Methylumidiphilus sp.]
NVWEWCADVLHDDYTDAPADGRAWLEGGEQDGRVLRGGSWIVNPQNLRSAYRNWCYSGLPNIDTGFRLARTLTP